MIKILKNHMVLFLVLTTLAVSLGAYRIHWYQSRGYTLKWSKADQRYLWVKTKPSRLHLDR